MNLLQHVGKWFLTGVGVATALTAVGSGWIAFMLHARGSMETASAYATMACSMAYASGGLLAVLWKRDV